MGRPAKCERASATELPFADSEFDAVITDPPYYDNESYSELSDVNYVWLKMVLSELYPLDFTSELTPKKKECVAAAYRQGGTQESARQFYESNLLRSLQEARRVLKPDGIMVVMYAHKTTSGWATLVDALRLAAFEVVEAWPIETESKERVAHQNDAALASTIFIVGRIRKELSIGSYEDDVRGNLGRIVRERVNTLWELGISGADLVIACIGAGLRAFTRYPKVEYSNGDQVPAERFLAEVETEVLDAILSRLSKEVSSVDTPYSLAGLDAATRFYTLWRYTYDSAELDAGEAIIFANGTHIELDGPEGLSSGARPLVEKKKGRYRLLDYAERGDDASLGMTSEDGQPAPLIDTLQRLLWLMERHPSGISEFLRKAEPNTEQLRLVSHALAGPTLKGGELGEVATGSELAALTKLVANWRNVVEDTTELEIGPLFRPAQ